MRVKELIEKLHEADENAVVLLSDEGLEYPAPCLSMDDAARWLPDKGELSIEHLYNDEYEKGSVACVVLVKES